MVLISCSVCEETFLYFPGMTVVDVGAAPGSWCQVVAKLVDLERNGGNVFGIDIQVYFDSLNCFLDGRVGSKLILSC